MAKIKVIDMRHDILSENEMQELPPELRDMLKGEVYKRQFAEYFPICYNILARQLPVEVHTQDAQLTCVFCKVTSEEIFEKYFNTDGVCLEKDLATLTEKTLPTCIRNLLHSKHAIREIAYQQCLHAPEGSVAFMVGDMIKLFRAFDCEKRHEETELLMAKAPSTTDQ
jgi:hypothetical protein